MSSVLTAGQILSVHAQIRPDKIGTRDSRRGLSFREWNSRSCRLANGLLATGLSKGDRVAVLAYNCVEWMEIYVALAKAGLVAVPINFRLTAPEILYIAKDCTACAVIVQGELRDRIDAIRGALSLPIERCIHFGSATTPCGYRDYEALIEGAAAREPAIALAREDVSALMYTSGTTGNPKGAIRTNEANALIALLTAVDMGFNAEDVGLLVMPMCHANSLYFAFTLTYLGAAVVVHDRKSFDAEEVLRALSTNRATFTSLVPTQYVLLLDLAADVVDRYPVDHVKRLMISSAPARKETKLAIMQLFRNSQLFELYGSTEAGFVTILRPEEQLQKLGSVGREWTGTGPVRILDEDGNDVPDGEVGELYSWTPFAFTGYWNLPEKTAEAFRGRYCTVGDMAYRDPDGYYHLVDRKSNMIISGGENIYPTEVEVLLARHPAVRDVAVIGIADAKWGEAVHAIVVLRPGTEATEGALVEWCRDKIAGYKRPRSVSFIADGDLPRTATGKIQHRVLRDRFR